MAASSKSSWWPRYSPRAAASSSPEWPRRNTAAPAGLFSTTPLRARGESGGCQGWVLRGEFRRQVVSVVPAHLRRRLRAGLAGAHTGSRPRALPLAAHPTTSTQHPAPTPPAPVPCNLHARPPHLLMRRRIALTGLPPLNSDSPRFSADLVTLAASNRSASSRRPSPPFPFPPFPFASSSAAAATAEAAAPAAAAAPPACGVASFAPSLSGAAQASRQCTTASRQRNAASRTAASCRAASCCCLGPEAAAPAAASAAAPPLSSSVRWDSRDRACAGGEQHVRQRVVDVASATRAAAGQDHM